MSRSDNLCSQRAEDGSPLERAQSEATSSARFSRAKQRHADPADHIPTIFLGTPWLAWALGLYALAGACWLPVLVLQLRMAKLAGAAVASGQPLPPVYWRMARAWEVLGYPAFVAMLVVFGLMVFKPA